MTRGVTNECVRVRRSILQESGNVAGGVADSMMDPMYIRIVPSWTRT